MEDSKRFYRRATILLAIFAACLLHFTALLYDAQVVHHEDYLTQSETQVTSSQTVETFRGNIVDCNGQVLASNREIYALTFDAGQVPAQENTPQSVTLANAILRLLRACQDEGVTWTDNLPITQTPPFNYTTSTLSSTQLGYFRRYLVSREWSDTELTAEQPNPMMSRSLQTKLDSMGGILPARTLLELMREDFGIDKDVPEEEQMTMAEARLVLGILYELELRQLDPNFYVPPYVLAEDVSGAFISLLKDGRFGGVVVSSQSVREYHTDYAAHILGRTGHFDSREELNRFNASWQAAKDAGEETSSAPPYDFEDIVGKNGIELAFEDYLRGKDGTRLITSNVDGKITSELYSTQPEPGGTVALTLDIDYQAQVEELLAQAVQEMNKKDGSDSRGAAAAVVSVADSSIRALATYPSFSQRTYVQDREEKEQDPGRPFFNRAVQGAYAPGSTFKPCSAVAALESGIITPSTKILTKGKYRYYKGYQPACWIYNQYGGSHGSINVSQALYHSCNYFFYEVGRLMGIKTLESYAAAFGLGQPTGIEISETTGILDGPDHRAESGAFWMDGDTLQCAIGQGENLFTPLQLANYIATLVRGGVRYETHLLDSVTSYDGSKILVDYEPVLADTVDMSDETLAAVRKGMGDLVAKGSVARYFKNCIVSAGAKTGSTQTGNSVANGVFVCFAPFEEPEIAVAIVIEQGGSGAALASTCVDIVNAYFTPSDTGSVFIPEGTMLP